MLDTFQYSGYRELLRALLRSNENVSFSDLPLGDPARRYFMVRHDVDFSLEAALRMASIEAEQGVRATYFLLFSSPVYNLLDDEYRTYPRRLRELGHEVGLHYDVSCYSCGPGAPSDFLNHELMLLEQLSGLPVRSIAMHNPSVHGADPFREMANLHNAYAPQHTSEIEYWSDSAGAWRNGVAERLANRDFPARLQLLIHPVFWAEHPGDRWSRLEELVEERAERLSSVLETSRGLWRAHSGAVEHDGRLRSRAVPL